MAIFATAILLIGQQVILSFHQDVISLANLLCQVIISAIVITMTNNLIS
jgi:hypothetical protein